VTPLDRPRLAQFLGVLAEAFNESVSELRLEAYYLALDDLEIGALESAGKSALNERFFPRPADLRRLVDGSRDGEAESAWMAVLREVRRVGYIGTPTLPAVALETIAGLWGSWGRLCQTLPGEGPELIGWAKQFKLSYGATAERMALPSFLPRDEAKQLHRRIFSENDQRSLRLVTSRLDPDKAKALEMLAREIESVAARCDELERGSE